MSFIVDNQNNTLQQLLFEKMSEYLSLNPMAMKTDALYDFYLEQVEPPLLEAVMANTQFNQVKAAKLLGMSRVTLRKKLKRYFGDKYFRRKESSDL